MDGGVAVIEVFTRQRAQRIMNSTCNDHGLPPELLGLLLRQP